MDKGDYVNNLFFVDIKYGFLIENHMGSTNKLFFPTYEQMYPESNNRPFLKQVREKLRYYGYSFYIRSNVKV